MVRRLVVLLLIQAMRGEEQQVAGPPKTSPMDYVPNNYTEHYQAAEAVMERIREEDTELQEQDDEADSFKQESDTADIEPSREDGSEITEAVVTTSGVALVLEDSSSEATESKEEATEETTADETAVKEEGFSHEQVPDKTANGAGEVGEVPRDATMETKSPDTRPGIEPAAIPEDFEYFDDRTLLDLFGQYAKEYLTTKVIPETDPTCQWDWRSFRCEPSCNCEYNYKHGDYHLGRSCRLRDIPPEVCKPTIYLKDRPAPKRILSLATQTTDILKFKVLNLVSSIKHATTKRYTNLQSNVCRDVWQNLENDCWNTVPSISIPEKLLCNVNDIAVCENAPIATLAFQQRREKIFAELYERDF